MTLTKLTVTHRQVTVTAHIRIENLHVARTIHRLERVIAVFRLGDEHVIAIVFPVPSLFPQRPIENLRRLDFLIAVFLIHATHVLLHLLPHCPAFWMPENQAGRFILKMKQIERTTEFAVIALFCLFQHVQIRILILFSSPGRAVDPLQHLVLGVATPIGAGQLHQLEHLELTSGRHVRTTAQVGEFTFGIERHILIGRNRLDDFRFIRFADRLEIRHGLVARQYLACDRLIFLCQFHHLLFNRLQSFRCKWLLVRKVVVKPVFDDRPDRHLRIGEQLLHGVSQQVGRRVTDHFQPVGVLIGHDRDVCVMLNQKRGIDNLAINFAGKRGFRKASADIGSHLRNRHRRVELTLRTIGKSDCNHFALHGGGL